MATRINCNWQPIRTIARAALTGTFQFFGSALTQRAKIIKIVNDTNAFIEVSTNGIDVQDVYPASSGTIWDVTANKLKTDGSFFRKNTQFRVRHNGTAPTTGTGVHLIVLEEAS